MQVFEHNLSFSHNNYKICCMLQIVKSVGPGDGLIDWSGDVLREAEVLMSLETSLEKVRVKTGGQTSVGRDLNQGNYGLIIQRDNLGN